MSRAAFQALAICAAVALPVFALGVRGGANTSYFVFAAMAAAAFLCSPRPGTQQPGSAHVAFGARMHAALAMPAASVLLTQVATNDFDGRAYEAPARFLLASALLWLLSLGSVPVRRLRHVQWGLAAGACVAAAALWAGSAAGQRPRPEFATAITFGNIGLVLGVCALLSLGWRLSRSPLEPALKILGGAAGGYASLLSQSRGGWLAVPVLLAVFILAARCRWRWKLCCCALSAAALAGAYGASDTVSERVRQAVAEYGAQTSPGGRTDSSVGLRLQFWHAALDMAWRHPLSGVGARNIQAEFGRRVAQGEMAPAAARFSHAHSDYLQALAANGVPGLLSLLAVYLAPLRRFVPAMRAPDRTRATAGRMGVTLVASYMVFGLTEHMFAISMNASFYCGLLVVLLALARESSQRERH